MRNFKSIGGCDVELGPLTLLVGPNGSGKSNFVDAIRFTADALNSTLEFALRERGGIKEVRRRSRGHPTHFGMRYELNLGPGITGTYAYRVAAKKPETFEVQREDCRIEVDGESHAYYTFESGELAEASEDFVLDEVEPDRLALQLLSADPSFRRVFDALANGGFYRLSLEALSDLQAPDAAEVLKPDGSNLASMVRELRLNDPETLSRIAEYLHAVVPGVREVHPKMVGRMETIEFRQEVSGDPNPWRYQAGSVSDGTLRGLGVLTAIFQRPRGSIPLVAIEEPETAVHPGAALKLMDALLEASQSRQVIATTHSPDLLDHPELHAEAVLAVEARGGNSYVGPVEERSLSAVRDRLYTVGELLRLQQVRPDLFTRERKTQLSLFDTGRW